MKIKKFEQGMTLVEIVIASSIFVLSTLAITTAFAACFKYNARNVRREKELNVQQTAIEKGNAGGVQVYKDTFTSGNRKTIQFVNPTGTGGARQDLGFTMAGTSDCTGVALYNAQNTEYNNEADINFQIKTFTHNQLGSGKTVSDVSNNCYLLHLTNTSSQNADVLVITNGSVIYNGDFASTHYESLTPEYSVALPAYVAGEEYMTDYNTYDGNGNLLSATSETTLPSERYLGVAMGPNVATRVVTVRVTWNGQVTDWNVPESVFLSGTNGQVNVSIDDTHGIRVTV